MILSLISCFKQEVQKIKEVRVLQMLFHYDIEIEFEIKVAGEFTYWNI